MEKEILTYKTKNKNLKQKYYNLEIVINLVILVYCNETFGLNFFFHHLFLYVILLYNQT